MRSKIFWIGIFGLAILVFFSCAKKTTGGSSGGTTLPPKSYGSMQSWITKGDRTALLSKQTDLSFLNANNPLTNIEVDSTTQFQQIDGFGYTLTGGSAQMINSLPAASKSALLQELFGSQEQSIGVSYLRISIGASDLNANSFTYDDMPSGQTDLSLTNFNLAPDKAAGTGLIPLLKEILLINPSIKILASPWSAPIWMKDNGSFIGGSLQTQFYQVYANYFVKYIQQMQSEGITIDAVTIQNEPQHGGNNPSMVMSASQQLNFIKSNLGPSLKAAALSTKIIVWDHNCDNPNYPITVMNDPAAKAFIDGAAFHLYAGDVSALSAVKNAHPDKNLYFTEQWTGANGSFDGDLKWHIKNVIIGTMRNWSRNALEWNLANDGSYGPHTPGGCSECKGALTIAGSTITRNVSYYIIGQISKFVPAGSVRIQSTQTGSIATAAFLTPQGKKVLVALNEGSTDALFNIKFKENWVTAFLSPGTVGTYLW